MGTTKNLEGREVAMTAKVFELLRQAVVGKKPDDHLLTREGKRPILDFRKAWWEPLPTGGPRQVRVSRLWPGLGWKEVRAVRRAEAKV